MKLKKAPFVLSFALSTLLVVGTTAFASGGSETGQSENGGSGNMMNANDNGMMNMMENGNMSNMMNAMNSPEGQEMMNTCGNFMESVSEEETAE